MAFLQFFFFFVILRGGRSLGEKEKEKRKEREGKRDGYGPREAFASFKRRVG